jgi:hypothetical protein
MVGFHPGAHRVQVKKGAVVSSPGAGWKKGRNEYTAALCESSHPCGGKYYLLVHTVLVVSSEDGGIERLRYGDAGSEKRAWRTASRQVFLAGESRIPASASPVNATLRPQSHTIPASGQKRWR